MGLKDLPRGKKRNVPKETGYLDANLNEIMQKVSFDRLELSHLTSFQKDVNSLLDHKGTRVCPIMDPARKGVYTVDLLHKSLISRAEIPITMGVLVLLEACNRFFEIDIQRCPPNANSWQQS